MSKIDIQFDWNGIDPRKSSLIGIAYVPDMPVFIEDEEGELVQSTMSVITLGLGLFTINTLFL